MVNKRDNKGGYLDNWSDIFESEMRLLTSKLNHNKPNRVTDKNIQHSTENKHLNN